MMIRPSSALVAFASLVSLRACFAWMATSRWLPKEQVGWHVFGLPRAKPRTRLLESLSTDSDFMVDGENRESSPVETIYSMPSLYDIAFSYRDFDHEVEFLLQQHQRLSKGQEPAGVVLELAAGPARHSILALQKYDTIQRVYCVDSSAAMADYACELASEQLTEDQASRFEYTIQDMRSFALLESIESEPIVDTVWILLGSLQHLLENSDVMECFASINQVLKPGGTVFVEIPHPRETFSMVECTKNGWEVPLEDDQGQEAGKVEIVWGDENDPFDPIRQVRQFTVSMDLTGEIPSSSSTSNLKSIKEVVPIRLFTAQEINALALYSGLQVVAMYGALEEGVDVDDEENAFRLVCVLQKNE